jgi:hypothetical protein
LLVDRTGGWVPVLWLALGAVAWNAVGWTLIALAGQSGGSGGQVFLALFALAGVVLIATAAARAWNAHRLGAAELLLDVWPLQPGAGARARFRRRIPPHEAVESIEVRLLCEEVMAADRGPGARAVLYQSSEQPVPTLTPVPGGILLEAAWMVQIPAEALPSILLYSRSIDWWIQVVQGLSGIGEVTSAFPIQVVSLDPRRTIRLRLVPR